MDHGKRTDSRIVLKKPMECASDGCHMPKVQEEIQEYKDLVIS
jgi:hypothetical protein